MYVAVLLLIATAIVAITTRNSGAAIGVLLIGAVAAFAWAAMKALNDNEKGEE